MEQSSTHFSKIKLIYDVKEKKRDRRRIHNKHAYSLYRRSMEMIGQFCVVFEADNITQIIHILRVDQWSVLPALFIHLFIIPEPIVNHFKYDIYVCENIVQWRFFFRSISLNTRDHFDCRSSSKCIWYILCYA